MSFFIYTHWLRRYANHIIWIDLTYTVHARKIRCFIVCNCYQNLSYFWHGKNQFLSLHSVMFNFGNRFFFVLSKTGISNTYTLLHAYFIYIRRFQCPVLFLSFFLLLNNHWGSQASDVLSLSHIPSSKEVGAMCTYAVADVRWYSVRVAIGTHWCANATRA